MRQFTDIARDKLAGGNELRFSDLNSLVHGARPFEIRRAIMRLVDSQEAVVTRSGKIKGNKTKIQKRRKIRSRVSATP